MRKIADAFRVLIDKTGQLFRAEGNIGVIRTRLPEDIKNGSIYDFFPEAGHTLVLKIFDSVTNNTEGRISDIAVLTSSSTERLFHLTVKPDGAVLWWFDFVESDKVLDTAPDAPPPAEPTVI